MNDNTNETLLGNDDMEDILNQTLDGTSAAPDFVTPPPALYALSVKDIVLNKAKETGKNHSIRVIYTIEDTIEIEGEQPVPNGSMFSENFQLTEKGLPYFKTRAMKIMDTDNVDGVSLKDLFDAMKGVNFDAKITIRTSPNPKGGVYENVNITVVKK